MLNLNHYFIKIKTKGFIYTVSWILKKPYFFFYKFLFKKCNKIGFAGCFQIRGKKYIQIDTFSAGSRIRIDGIDKFNDQIFNPSSKHPVCHVFC